jgi:hypothetical protein
MVMFPLLSLVSLSGCLPYDGLDPDIATVQNARFVDCEADAVSEQQRPNGNWRPYFGRVQRFDTYGNLAFDRLDGQGEFEGLFYEVTSEYRGQWLDAYDEIDALSGTPIEIRERRTWDGPFLLEVVYTFDGQTERSTFTNDGVSPYTAAEVDRNDDGLIDQENTYDWEGELLIGATFDLGPDGAIDAQDRYEYDEDGRVSRYESEQTASYRYVDQEFAGPHDNLLYYRDETGGDDLPERVDEQVWIWDEGWTVAEYEVTVDGQVTETGEQTFDDDGRLLTNLREFPDGQPIRETWSWTCP